MQPAIFVEGLTKTFSMRKTSTSAWQTLKALFSPEIVAYEAAKSLSFSINPGEKVAFIGPNGAGKSTTIKMLTGILYPSSGTAQVLGLVPWIDRHQLGFKIGTVFGQRSQLWYQLPARDTFRLLAKIYELSDSTYKKRVDELSQLFELEELLDRPVRQLSLGERMRCELVASLIHKPQILFLDEPTIGLDLNAKLLIRDLLNRLSDEQGTTLFLTSHDTQDIEQVAERVLVLDQGSLILDSSLTNLRKTYLKKKVITLITEEELIQLSLPGIQVLSKRPYHFVMEVDLSIQSIDKVIHEALQVASVKDITIEDPSMEEIIRDVYNS